MAGDQDGVLSLEFALALPMLLLAVLAALQGLALGRDVLIVHEAARAGARAAATSTGSGAVDAAISEALDGRDADRTISPPERKTGDLVVVTVVLTSRIGPQELEVSATSAARVEPGVGR
ncbi:MAG: TadE/TadG family type IV pilus assembly protein [Nitriliruptorales bacterium]|nr:TadE/TadG family type IV pilus assembly protein [Nitriliruptorales bacterium]